MSDITIRTIALVGAGFVIFSLWSLFTGRIRYSSGDRDFGYIERSKRPQAFWLTTLGCLAGGIIALAIAAFFYFRG
jgi:hypothetical protein